MTRWDEDGFSSCSTCPCHRAAPNHPAGVSDCLGQPTACHVAFAPRERARPPGSFCRGHHWVHLRCGPVTRSPSRGWLGRSASSVSFPPRMRPKLRRFLTLPPVGLTPTEHASLSWTHSFARIHDVFLLVHVLDTTRGPTRRRECLDHLIVLNAAGLRRV